MNYDTPYVFRPALSFLLSAVLTGLALCLVARPALAGPPVPAVFTVSQPDGITTFQARIWGDETANGLETIDGYTVLADPASGFWYYARLDPGTGQLVRTGRLAGQDSPPPAARGARPVVVGIQRAPLIAQGPVGQPSVPVLVILVQYNSRPARTTEAEWQAAFFGPRPSVRDYYDEISYGQFSLLPAAETCGSRAGDGLTGWLTLATTHPNSGGPSITRAALTAADPCVNYASFDRNGDGDITSSELLPIVIVAGYETSYGGPLALTPGVWGHQSIVNYKSLADGVTILPYAQFGEWHAATWDYSGHRATIGTMVHEIGHLLGWPDLYDVSPPGNPDSEGVGEWSLMGSGLWLGWPYPGDTPAHPSAWEKWYQGWLTPLQLHGLNLTRGVPRAEDNRSNAVIQLRDNPNGVDWRFEESSGSGEYFLVENRQKVGYDAQLPGCGLLIWHIDESVTASNWANGDKNHRLVDLEEADGWSHLDSKINRGDTGDPYPGLGGNPTFDATSIPNSKFYNQSISGIAITQISPGCADAKVATFRTVVIPSLSVSIAAQPAYIEITTTLITYTITIKNDGDGSATGLRITNTIPVSASYITGSASHGGVETAPGSGVITWPATTLAVSSAITRTFLVTVTAPLTEGDKLTDVVSVVSDQDINIDNFAQVETVGLRSIYLPVILKK